MTVMEWIILFIIATLGHVMALLWYVAGKSGWRIAQRTIYDLPINDRQVRREMINSIHTPIHAVLLLACIWFGLFANRTVISFVATLLLTTAWAEIWHYCSHRAFHLKSLHWIHAEHHKSRLNSPFTAISFSFPEKLIFDAGMLIALGLIDMAVSLNFYGIAGWYIGYLAINSFSHANFEFRPATYNRFLGKFLATTTYHSLHHSRYTGNYGLGTRFLDRLFGTEWEDYEAVYDRVTVEKRPLEQLRQKVGAPSP